MGKRLALKAQYAKFAREYVAHGDATRAAIAAGYAEPSADQRGAVLLQRPDVAAEIERLNTIASAGAIVSRQAVLEELGRLAMFDIGKLYHKDGTPKQIHEVDEDTRRALLEHNIAVDEFGNRSVKVINAGKVKALELLAKHFGILEQKQGETGPKISIDINFGDAQPPIKVVNKSLDAKDRGVIDVPALPLEGNDDERTGD